MILHIWKQAAFQIDRNKNKNKTAYRGSELQIEREALFVIHCFLYDRKLVGFLFCKTGFGGIEKKLEYKE